MKKALYFAIVGIASLYLFSTVANWLSSSPAEAVISEAPAPTTPLKQGLNLQALSGVVKEVRGGQELERRLNEEGGINNLDLDENDQVDYIQVTEFDSSADSMGYSLTVEPVQAETQEIAEVTVQKNGDRAEIQLVGNEQIYGPNAIYNDWTEVEREVQSSAPTHHYNSYFHPHSLWFSPFGFGFYPPYYGFFPRVPFSMYQSRYAPYQSASFNNGRNAHQQNNPKNFKNQNKNKAASSVRANRLTKPTASQRTFTANRNARAGGFGQRKATSQRFNNKFQGTKTNRSFGNKTTKSLRSGGFGGGSRSARSFGK